MKTQSKQHKNSPEVRQFIRENQDLFWYIRKDAIEEISHDTLVEFILNYGDLKAVKKLFELLGIEQVAKIFYKHVNKKGTIANKRINYLKLVKNFFDLYFQKNVSYKHT